MTLVLRHDVLMEVIEAYNSSINLHETPIVSTVRGPLLILSIGTLDVDSPRLDFIISYGNVSLVASSSEAEEFFIIQRLARGTNILRERR